MYVGLELEVTRMACVLGYRAQELDHGSFSSRCAIGLHGNYSVTCSHGAHFRFLPRRRGKSPVC